MSNKSKARHIEQEKVCKKTAREKRKGRAGSRKQAAYNQSIKHLSNQYLLTYESYNYNYYCHLNNQGISKQLFLSHQGSLNLALKTNTKCDHTISTKEVLLFPERRGKKKSGIRQWILIPRDIPLHKNIHPHSNQFPYPILFPSFHLFPFPS